jgi:dual specificity phosphatase 12
MGQGQEAFSHYRRDTKAILQVKRKKEINNTFQIKKKIKKKLQCNLWYLVPEVNGWIGATESEGMDGSAREGRINCPNCSTKLGTWSWHGAQCSCGQWIIPSFAIPKTKADRLQRQRPPKD